LYPLTQVFLVSATPEKVGQSFLSESRYQLPLPLMGIDSHTLAQPGLRRVEQGNVQNRAGVWGGGIHL